MRQAGVIAAAGIYALEKNLPLLEQDHLRASDLARKLGSIKTLSLEHQKPPSNMVYVNLEDEVPLDAEETAIKLKKLGVLVGTTGERQIRLVVHLWIEDQDIDDVVQAFTEVLS